MPGTQWVSEIHSGARKFTKIATSGSATRHGAARMSLSVGCRTRIFAFVAWLMQLLLAVERVGFVYSIYEFP